MNGTILIFLNACGNDNKNIANSTTANTTPGGNDLVVVQPVSPAQPAENETSGPSDTQVNVAVPNDRIIGQWKLAYTTSIQNGQPVETVSNETDYWTFFEDGTFTDAVERNDNIHTARMSLNSNVLIPLGISVADRAKLLGHSVATNLQYYSYAQKDYTENARNVLNHMSRAAKDNNLTLLNTCRVNYTEK